MTIVLLKPRSTVGARPPPPNWPGLPGLRDDRREAYDAGRNPIFLGEVQGLGIRPVRRLIGEPG